MLSPDWRRMGLVHDEREALPRQLPDLLGDHGELLEGGDDDGFARLQRLLELAARRVDVLHHAEGLLELPHRDLELAVEHPAVGHNDDRVEYPLVGGIVERGELVGQPGDSEALPLPAEC